MRLHGSVAEACVQQWLEEINALFPQSPPALSSGESQTISMAPAADISVATEATVEGVSSPADAACGPLQTPKTECFRSSSEAARGDLSATEMAGDRWADPNSDLFREQVDSLKRAINYTRRLLIRTKLGNRSRSRSRSQTSQHMRQSAEAAVGSVSLGCGVWDEGPNLNGRMRVDTSDELTPISFLIPQKRRHVRHDVASNP